MSVLPIQKAIPAKDAVASGNTRITEEGSVSNTVYAGNSWKLTFRFALPRSTITNKGLRITHVDTVYKLKSGILTEVNTALHRAVYEDSAVNTKSVVPTTPSDFILTPSSVLFRKVSTSVDTPSWDNQNANVSVVYTFAVEFIANTTCELEIANIDIRYDLSDMSDGSVETVTLDASGAVTAESISTGSISTDTITAVTTNSNLSLNGNGTGSVNINNGIVVSPVTNVTQTSSLSSDVNVNGRSGIITTYNAELSPMSSEIFTVNNNLVKSSSMVFVNIMNYSGTVGTNGFPYVFVNGWSDGYFNITVLNTHLVDALSGVLKISYLIIN